MTVTTLRFLVATLNRKTVRVTLFSCVVFLVANPLHADSIDYTFTLTVDTIHFGLCNPLFHQFGCDLEVGDQFVGSFLIDDALLSQTGNNLPGLISNFFLQVGTVVWDQAHPYPTSDFRGFRGPPSGLGARSPGFDVSGGSITGLEGGVYGLADAPFVDFHGTTFSAIDLRGTNIQGTLTLAVPEPSSILLVGTALIGIIGAMRRKLLA